jgi:hypothetical protein
MKWLLCNSEPWFSNRPALCGMCYQWSVIVVKTTVSVPEIVAAQWYWTCTRVIAAWNHDLYCSVRAAGCYRWCRHRFFHFFVTAKPATAWCLFKWIEGIKVTWCKVKKFMVVVAEPWTWGFEFSVLLQTQTGASIVVGPEHSFWQQSSSVVVNCRFQFVCCLASYHLHTQ